MNSFRKGKTNAKSPYWIKHRIRASDAMSYYEAMGQQLVSRIQQLEKKGCLVGDAVYHRFDTKEAYMAHRAALVANGARFI